MSRRRILCALAVILVLVAAGWACEEAGLSQMSDVLQRRWDCWAEQTRTRATCAPQRHVAHDDADWCESAVAACRAKGFDRAAEAAEANWGRWQATGAMFRILAALASVALVLSVGWRWMTRRRSG
ncbi:hypothetical protein ASC95_05675 [Pelomonas sp. Root1217]|uniref:hypothetical protein n=1 Tax=Pelomonas sp. Root1217 TaxID=1736430 RepID=UPI000710D094|nr:hypothetical protein [Pelomonas sp. Root1217]KQV60912.1 hypothetical protein ASC95_05675 [Pelomonas sp. Root1217]